MGDDDDVIWFSKNVAKVYLGPKLASDSDSQDSVS